MASQIDSERVKKYLAEILSKIQTQADPDLLSRYRSLIKKEVSFFRRSYVTAYLLMEWDRKTGNPGARGTRFRKNFQAGSPPEDAFKAEPRVYPLAIEDSARLFISAGRSRRVFPREILSLIASKTTVSKEDIGAIRILDNYSFVQVRSSRADEIIEALNGVSFRGRPLTVNYARNRKEEDGLEQAETESLEEGPVETPSEALSGAEAQTGSAEYLEASGEEPALEISFEQGDDHSDKEGV